MQLQVRQVINRDFQVALRALSGVSCPSLSQNMLVVKLIKRVQEISDAFAKTHEAIMGEHAAKLPDGTWKVDVARVDSLNARLIQVESETVEVPDVKLKLPENARLCPRDILALEAFLDV